MANLEKHVENNRQFRETPIVALNRFASDTEAEVDVVRARCAELGVRFAVSDGRDRGGDGAVELAQAVLEQAEDEPRPFRQLYRWDEPVLDKIARVAQQMYGARRVTLDPRARKDLALVERLGFDKLPVCIAKTQSSLSDDPALLGRPDPFDFGVRRITIQAGAGFLVVLAGEILLMPGLPAVPRAESIDLRDGVIVGLE
jgi:formate--tetrahydrofolate ligase